jgi:hypothetical protein
MSKGQQAKRTNPYLPQRILVGRHEPIFATLPQAVRANLLHRASENALVWNLVYPLAVSGLSLHALLGLRPLWGTAQLDEPEDVLQAFFWGYGIQGERLPGLDDVLSALDGPGPHTEVDLFLLGESTLVLAEAKHTGGLGRCARFASRRCPQAAGHDEGLSPCRYWDAPQSMFRQILEFPTPPFAPDVPPPCSVHYQLARTLLVGMALSERLERRLHVWLLTPRQRWQVLERTWVQFTEYLREDALWRRLRVLAWEDVRKIQRLPPG